ncbi:hypothetical protein [Actinomadura violacea]|uniref:Uncharacterized protein n=1 Tax=Actinomadura violacea TaxID=2819934 RepID=A0ABS3RRK3_9ACTN|nr:hypothetical protein [Actinomadura violacea]MBO2459367.1 hypothetical protein [Actinomadura violacea]
MIDLRHVGSALIYLGYLAAALTAIGIVMRWVVLRWVMRPLKTWLREQIKAPLEGVHAEMLPNHGGSLRDAVNRIETRQNAMSERFRDHIINHPGAS